MKSWGVAALPVELRRSVEQPLSRYILWSLAILGLAARLAMASQTTGGDFAPVWEAVRSFLHNQPPYQIPLFVYPPSSLLLFAPLGLAGFSSSLLIFLVVDLAAIVLAAGCCLLLFGARLTSPWGAATLVSLCLFAPVTQTLNQGSVNGLVLAAEAGALLAASRRRWLLAGALLGLSFAIKPVLLPLLLIPLLYRRWAAAVISLAVPAVLSAVALSLATDGGLYASQVIPSLLRGPAATGQSENVALAGAVLELGLPAQLGLWLRLGLLSLAAAIAWVRWRSGGDETLRLVEMAGLILITTFLAHSFAWMYYAIYLLPLFVSVLHPASAMRSGLAAAGLYGVGGPDIRLWLLLGLTGSRVVHVRSTLGFLLLLVALASATFSRGRFRSSRRVAPP
jgi:arabinofuranan 3-O-arabinosyltransferase